MRPAVLLIALFNFYVLCSQSVESNVKAQWFNKALVAKALGKTDSILFYLEKAEAIADSTTTPNKLPILIQLEKAKYARSKEDVKLFLNAIKKAEMLIIRDTARTLSDELYALQAQYYFHTKEYEKALAFLHQTEEYRKIHSPFKNWKTYRLMAAIYKAQGETAKAKEFSQKSETLAEIQATLKNISETEFAPALKTHEMTQIQLENALIHNQNTTIQAQKKQLKMALVFCGIIIP